jgi:tRNA pseudouridine38-40 synthase
MQTYKLTLEYDGTHFSGYQSQKNARTVQDVLEGALQKIYKKKVRIIGASRTDSGVHAEGQVVHYKIDKNIPLKNLIHAINSNLPEDVAVKKIKKVSPQFHARFTAKKKTYVYEVKLSKIPAPLERNRVYSYFYLLDINKIRKAARLLVGNHDFKSFQAKSSEREMSTTRTLLKLETTQKKEKLTFLFEGNGFLYNMVRNIVGSLLEVGRGKMSLGEFKRGFEAKDRRRMGPTAPPQGLTLKRIAY